MAYRESLTEHDARAVLEAAGIPSTLVTITADTATAWIQPLQAWTVYKRKGRTITPIDFAGVKGRLEKQGAHLSQYSHVRQEEMQVVIQFRLLEAA